MASKPLPNDYRATPYLICRNAIDALDWYKSPESIGGSPVSIHVLVDDVDQIYGKVIRLGAKEKMAGEE